MNRIVLLSRLHAEVEPADYEKWVVETDYPFARGLTAIQTYEASRVENYIFGTDGKFVGSDLVNGVTISFTRSAPSVCEQTRDTFQCAIEIRVSQFVSL